MEHKGHSHLTKKVVGNKRFAVLMAAALVVGLLGFAGPSTGAAQTGTVTAEVEQDVAAQCFAVHKFGAQPVDVAKAADRETVLAQLNWGFHESIGCYLTLDEVALAVLRAAPAPQGFPAGDPSAAQQCSEIHKFGAQPVDVAKIAGSQTVLAQVRWGFHESIGCFLALDAASTAVLRANAASTTPQPDAEDTTETEEQPESTGPWIGVSTGSSHSCGLRADGTITCWGWGGDIGSWFGELPNDQFSSVSARGDRHICGLTAGGTIKCNRDLVLEGQFTSMTTGGGLVCGISSDQAILCNSHFYSGGQFSPMQGQFTSVSLASVRTGGEWRVPVFGCGIGADETLACWGRDYVGPQGGFGFQDPPEGTFTALSTRFWYSCGIRSDSTITCWLNYKPQASGNAPPGPGIDLPAPPSGEFASISGTCGLRKDGTIVCWGANLEAPAGQFSAVSASDRHACGLTTGGEIVCWGANSDGQTEVPA